MTNGLAVELRGISKRFGSTQALDDVSVDIEAGRIHGLAGPNGSGKSTLLKVLVGLYEPDGGAIHLDGAPTRLGGPLDARRCGIELVAQEFALVPTMTVWENIVLGSEPRRRRQLDRAEARRRARATLERLDVAVDIDLAVGSLNPAEQRLIMVARGLQREPRLLIADEPTAGVPPAQSAAVVDALRRLARQSVTVVFVSHDLAEMAELCESATVLLDGRVRIALGRNELNTRALIDALVEQTTVADVAEPPEEIVEQAVDQGEEPASLRVRALSGASLEPLDLDVHAGEVVGVAGLLGSGREELIDLLVGVRPRSGGSIDVDGVSVTSPVSARRAGVGYVHGDRSIAAIPMWDVTEHITLPGLHRWRRRGTLDRRRERRDAASAMSLLSVKAAPSDRFSGLSGGNQQRALLARWIANDCTVLLVDEPCVGVDINSRAELLRVLRGFGETRAVVVASSDPADLAAICDRVLCLVDGHVVRQLEGDDVTEHAILSLINDDGQLAAAALHSVVPSSSTVEYTDSIGAIR